MASLLHSPGPALKLVMHLFATYNKESQKETGADRRGAAIKNWRGLGWPDEWLRFFNGALVFPSIVISLRTSMETVHFLKEMY